MQAKRPSRVSAWLIIPGLAVMAASGAEQQTLTVAAVQYRPTSVPAENLNQLRALIKAAARQGASAVVLPEHALMGPFPAEATAGADIRLWEMAAAQSERALAGLAKESAIWIASSATERAADRKSVVVNSVVFDHTGQMARRQSKLQPRKLWGDGDAVPGDSRLLGSMDFPGGRIGVTSGDDMTKTVPRLATLGAETVMISASWESSDVTEWRNLARDLAIRNHVNLVISNLTAEQTPKELWSVLIAKDGTVLAEANAAGNQTVVASVPVRKKSRQWVLGLPDPPVPANAVPTARDIEFGRALFFDGKLASDGKTSCGVCHDPALAFADGKRLAAGVSDRVGHRNTPSLLNSVYKTFYGWDGTVETMERQAMHALRGWAEMNRTLPEAAEYVNTAPAYGEFREAAGGRLEADHIFRAVSAFMRTLVSGDSPFDRYYYGSEIQAIDDSARRGLKLFRSKAKCAQCHELRPRDALFTDNAFHNTGVGFHKRFEYLGYSGDGIEGNQATKNRFRGEYITPTLRNIALTAPYMHDGSLATLEDVVDFYDRGANPNPFLDPKLHPLNLTPEERADLVAFLKTLTGTHTDKNPATVTQRRN
jgi:cytochrome c peroxidase